MKILIYTLLGLTTLAYSQNKTKKEVKNTAVVHKAKFEPDDGECLFFIGQDLGAIGGLKDYNDGDVDHFPVPAGITAYTNFRPGDESFGHTYKGLDGVTTTDNWGAGDCNMQLILDDPKFAHCVLAIGLELVNHEGATARGDRDSMIVALGSWIKGLGERPVFLRIGYEFDGHAWNHYDREEYLKAFKRIHHMFDSLNVENVAYVWQSTGNGSDQEELANWYPGDEYVDWCGYSYFTNPDEEMLTFARKHNKPVFIAELSPVLPGDKGDESYLSNPEIAKHAWETWFTKFFNLLNENEDLIKAFSYINVDWYTQAMWKVNEVFDNVDSRIQKSEYVSQKWINEVSKEKYLKPDENLWKKLNAKK